MASILKNLRLLADPSRVRILLLLEREELSVAELQEILAMGQSRISTHLAQLKQAGLVEDRRIGKSILYRFKASTNGDFSDLLKVLRDAAAEIPEAADDSAALKLALARRQDRCAPTSTNWRASSDGIMFPGRSWKGLAEMLLEADAANGDRGSGRRRGNVFSTPGPAREARDRGRQFAEDGGVRGGAGAQARRPEPGIPAGRSGGGSDCGSKCRPGVLQPGAAPCAAS